jgi:hypothetical protein
MSNNVKKSPQNNKRESIVNFYLSKSIKRSMKKESVIYNTQDMMTEKVKKKGNVLDLLIHYTKDHNYHKFVETSRKQLFNPETRNDQGMTLLNVAAQCSSISILKYLMNIGAEVNTQDVIINNTDIFKFTSPLCFNAEELQNG